MSRTHAALACTFFLLTSSVAAGSPSPADLFESKCTTCHGADRALRKRKDRAGWEKTVSRMKRYASGLISDADAVVIVEYLTRERGPES